MAVVGDGVEAAGMTDGLTLPSARAAAYAVASHGAGTTRAYRTAWSAWSAWCERHDREPLASDETALSAYLAERADAGLSPSSLAVALAAIRHAHKLAGVPWTPGDRVAMVLRGIAREHAGEGPARQATPATVEALQAMLPHCGTRDRALLLTGFGAALRRSELVALDVADVTIERRGVLVRIRRSKGDQLGAGELRGIARGTPPFCAADALTRWLRERGDLAPGALFCIPIGGRPQRLNDRTVARVVGTAARKAGLPGAWSGHSLRAGFLTSASARGASLAELAQHARHARPETTLGYIRQETAWDANPSSLVFTTT